MRPIPVGVSMVRTSMDFGECAFARARVTADIILKFEVSLRAFQPSTMRQLARTHLGVRRDVSSLFISTRYGP
jgi:hypothetical protein